MERLVGKVALVTSAGRGVGRKIATLLASEGAKVALLSHTHENLRKVVTQIHFAGGEAIAIACDISCTEQIDTAVKTVIQTYGSIDVLVNNAFDPSTPFTSATDFSTEQLQRNFEEGPLIYLKLMQASHPYLKKNGCGRVINLGAYTDAIALVGYGSYSVANEAVRALTTAAAREWAEDAITVNNILPLANKRNRYTEGLPQPSVLDRAISPEEDIAPLVLFLATDDSQSLTGYSLTLDYDSSLDPGESILRSYHSTCSSADETPG